jgi:hypothetical protein
MRYDDTGDDILGDDLLGDELVGDEIVGDEIVGDEIVGDDVLGDDIVGDELTGDDVLGDEIVGDDVLGDDILGYDMGRAGRLRRFRRARKVRARKLANLRKRAILARRLASAKVVVKKPLGKARVQSLGFNAEVGAGQTLDIPARPQVKFQGSRLSVPTSIAPFFMIEDIKVGRNSQFVAAAAQSAETYKDTSTVDNLRLDACEPGMDIILTVRNITGTTSDFRATLFGDAIE